ncbi:uncharacterized protein LOC132302347 isoform X2 [Cornus florida]|uniref:uncharacterized protein LOC132302347 isoform X2 n=1 Tax=Cornus florida TaxID=4283 RepID=UPI00289D2E2A|nr:uncharacterized protein LOC132302347 isoform X2 [Cornus florida]
MASSRPLATVSRLFSNSLRRLHHHRLNNFSPSAGAHSFCTGHSSNEEVHPSNEGVIDLESKVVDDSYKCSKIDVPGLNSKDLKIWVNEKGEIKYEGRSKSLPKYEYKGRLYQGTIEVCPDCHVEQFKAEVIHGVLWITSPLTTKEKIRLKKKSDELLDQKGDEKV